MSSNKRPITVDSTASKRPRDVIPQSGPASWWQQQQMPQAPMPQAQLQLPQPPMPPQQQFPYMPGMGMGMYPPAYPVHPYPIYGMNAPFPYQPPLQPLYTMQQHPPHPPRVQQRQPTPPSPLRVPSPAQKRVSSPVLTAPTTDLPKAITNMRPGTGKPSRVLLIRVNKLEYPVTIPALLDIFNQFGQVKKIVIFDKGSGLQALLEYLDIEVARAAHDVADQTEMMEGCNVLRVGYSSLKSITVPQNTERSWDHEIAMANLNETLINPAIQTSAGVYYKNPDGKKGMYRHQYTGAPGPYRMPGKERRPTHQQYGPPATQIDIQEPRRPADIFSAPSLSWPAIDCRRRLVLAPSQFSSLAGSPSKGASPGPTDELLQATAKVTVHDLEDEEEEDEPMRRPRDGGSSSNSSTSSSNYGSNNNNKRKSVPVVPIQEDTWEESAVQGQNPILAVRNVDPEVVTPQALCQLFGCYGDVMKVMIKGGRPNPLGMGVAGVALVEMRNSVQAQNAKRYLTGKPLGGQIIRVEPSRQETIKDPNSTDFSQSTLCHRFADVSGPDDERYREAVCEPGRMLVFENIGADTTSEHVMELVSEYGRVKRVELEDAQAIVHFQDPESAIHTLVMTHNLRWRGGLTLKVKFHNPEFF